MKKWAVIFGFVFMCLLSCKNHNQRAAHSILNTKKYPEFCKAADELLADCGFSGAVLVAKGNSVIYAKGCGLKDSAFGNSEENQNSIYTTFEAGSLTKQLVGAAILQLEKQKKLSLSDGLDKYFPEVKDSEKITIRMLLNMRSGLTDHINAGSDFFPKNVYRQIEKNQRENLKVEENIVLTYLPDAPFISKPDSTYFYCNTNYYLLAKIIEKVSGQSYSDFMKENILEKAGMSDSNFEFQSAAAKGYSKGKFYSIPKELAFGCGDLNSTVMDLWNWNKAFTSGKICSKKYIRELKKARGYCYGWNCGNNLIFHAGNTNVYNSYNSYDFKNHVSVIVLANKPINECSATIIADRLKKIKM